MPSNSMPALPAYARDRGVERGPAADHGQHAATGGDDRAVGVTRGPRMKDDDVLERGGLLETVDRHPRLARLRVARGTRGRPRHSFPA